MSTHDDVTDRECPTPEPELVAGIIQRTPGRVAPDHDHDREMGELFNPRAST